MTFERARSGEVALSLSLFFYLTFHARTNNTNGESTVEERSMLHNNYDSDKSNKCFE